MDKCEIIKRLKNIAEHAVHTVGEEPFVMSLGDGIAVHEAIKLLNKPETNCSEFPNNSDTIYRQQAIEDAMAWVAIDSREERLKTDVIEWLKEFPSAQPDIIRCKDCKWYGRADKRRFYRGMDCLQKRIDTIVPDRDFCSRAERREDETD